MRAHFKALSLNALLDSLFKTQAIEFAFDQIILNPKRTLSVTKSRLLFPVSMMIATSGFSALMR